MIYTAGEERKAISLEIKTIVIDEMPEVDDIAKELGEFLAMLDRGGISDEGFDPSSLLEERFGNSDNVDELILRTEAEIGTDDHGNVVIEYNENEEDAQIATRAKIIFSPETPDLLIMTKEGAMDAVLSFEEGKTHICQYKTPYMPIKVYVETKTVKNTLLSDGRLALDYTISLNDTDPQHFIISVKMKEVEEDTIRSLLS